MTKKVARNDPCPCGSGKKYKKCCGVNAGKKSLSGRVSATTSTKLAQSLFSKVQAPKPKAPKEESS